MACRRTAALSAPRASNWHGWPLGSRRLVRSPRLSGRIWLVSFIRCGLAPGGGSRGRCLSASRIGPPACSSLGAGRRRLPRRARGRSASPGAIDARAGCRDRSKPSRACLGGALANLAERLARLERLEREFDKARGREARVAQRARLRRGARDQQPAGEHLGPRANVACRRARSRAAAAAGGDPRSGDAARTR